MIISLTLILVTIIIYLKYYFNNEKNKPIGTNPKKSGNWVIMGASVRGKSHIDNNIPCQDFHVIENINESWGIAVICDGAGSASHSQIGSEFVAKESLKVFKDIILNKKLDNMPKIGDWKKLAKEGLEQVRQNMEAYARNTGYKLESLACTVIITIYSPDGILIAHIGDGRAGFLGKDGEWRAMMRPWKGEEANQTVFITSAIWNKDIIDNYLKCNIINDKIAAFTLLSDGCEAFSYQCSIFNEAINQWHDPNIPYSGFFNPLVAALQSSYSSVKQSDIQDKWKNFLSTGNERIINELDDKTLILGVYIEDNK